MTEINCWEIAVSLADSNIPGSDKAKKFVDACSGVSRFGNELKWGIEGGVWHVELVAYDNPGVGASMSVHPDGRVRITRLTNRFGVLDKREVSF